MQNLIGSLFSVALLVLVVKRIQKGYFFSRQEYEEEQYYPYHRRKYFMTAAEYAFFKVLQEAVQDRYFIVPQVTLSNLVDVNDGYKWNKSWRSKIDKKSVDFVLFNKGGYTPYLAIELDDSTHSRSERIERDEFVERVLQRAGMKLVRIKSEFEYDRNRILATLSL